MKEDKTYEVCPQCGEEVELDAELKIQSCPSCGARIVTCSMCRAVDEDSECCRKCPLEVQAKIENKESKAYKEFLGAMASMSGKGLEIMNTTNGHDPNSVELINALWKRNSEKFKNILCALYIRDKEEMIGKGYVEKIGEAIRHWRNYAYDYLMHIADDMDLEAIIYFLRCGYGL